ncbi:hypothetical protein B566_EDAN012292 [Ephemera danica]|nr:hypothetical protein B566_EDAN012292 [Ephemera danica]
MKRQLVASVSAHSGLSGTGKLLTCCETPTGSFWVKSSITQCLGRKPDVILFKWCEQMNFNKIITANGRYSYVEAKMPDGLVDYEAFKVHLQNKLPSVWKTDIAVIVDSCLPLVNSLAMKSIGKSLDDTDHPTTLHGLVLVQCMQRKIPLHCADGYSSVKSESDNCKKLSNLIEKCDKNGGQITEPPLKRISLHSVAVTGDPNLVQQPGDAAV